MYLLTRRLERAAALLRNTDRSVAEICLDVGLTSVGSFTTSFTRMFGHPDGVPRRSSRPPPRGRRAVLRRPRVRPARPQHRTFREDSGRGGHSLRSMIKIATTQIWVHDQDEALAFYTEKLGFEVREDVTCPRWATSAG